MTKPDHHKQDAAPPAAAQSAGNVHAQSGSVAGNINYSTINVTHAQSLQDLAVAIGGRDAWQAYPLFEALDLSTRATLMNSYLPIEKARALVPIIAAREDIRQCADVLFETSASRMVTLLEMEDEDLRSQLIEAISTTIAMNEAGGSPGREQKLRDVASANPDTGATIVERIARMSLPSGHDGGQKRVTALLSAMPDRSFLARLPDTQAATDLLFSLPWHDEVAQILISIDHTQMAHHLTRASGPGAAYTVERALQIDAERIATALSRLPANGTATLVRLVHFREGTELLTRLGKISPSQLRDVVQALPPRLAAAMISQQSDRRPGLRDRQRMILPKLHTTGWMQIDAVCTVLSVVGPATARLIHRKKLGWPLAVKEERENVRRTWRAAVHAFQPEYRRQRNHLAWLAIALVIVIVVMAL